MVRKLREETGAGMMECKSALVEASGDAKAAVDILRKKGLASAAKKAGRAANEGQVAAYLHDGGKTGVLVEVNSETDFVAKTAEFQQLVTDVATHVAVTSPADALAAGALKDVTDTTALLAQAHHKQPSQTLGQLVQEKIAVIKENIVVRRFSGFRSEGAGLVGSYIHQGGKVGVLVEVGAQNAATVQSPDFAQLVKDVAMHIAAASPAAALYVGKEEVPADVLAKEKEIYKAQAAASGKPANVVDKIAEGKLKEYYATFCLLEQAYVREPKITVGQLLKDKSAALKDTIVVRRFSRFRVGEEIAGAPAQPAS
jgi:elongation factor Ts